MQYNVNITLYSNGRLYYSLSHVKSTQQSLCMNFVRRRSRATLGSAKIALDTVSQALYQTC